MTHTIDLPLSEAANGLTGWEALSIQKHFNTPFEKLGAIEMLIGVAYIYRHRSDPAVTWADVKSAPIKDLQESFAPEPADPDSEMGKGSISDE